MRPDPWSGLIALACGVLAVVLIILAAATANPSCPTNQVCEVTR